MNAIKIFLAVLLLVFNTYPMRMPWLDCGSSSHGDIQNTDLNSLIQTNNNLRLLNHRLTQEIAQLRTRVNELADLLEQIEGH